MSACSTPEAPSGHLDDEVRDVPTVSWTSRQERLTDERIIEALGLERRDQGGWVSREAPGCPIDHLYTTALFGAMYDQQGDRVIATPDKSAGVVLGPDAAGSCTDRLEVLLSRLT